jgi:hypothetical protein
LESAAHRQRLIAHIAEKTRMTTLSVVIPAYNEEDSIAEIAYRVLAIRDDLTRVGVDDLELLIVDDGSRDKTGEIARNIAGVRFIQHPYNRGYGAALKTGFREAKGELVGFLDADGTYPPEYFPQLCKVALDGSELVVGSRMVGATSKMPLTRRIGNVFFAALLSTIGCQRVTDSASGMRVFKREVFAHICPLPDGLNLTPVMSTRAVYENITFSEVPIPYSERLGRSKLHVLHDGQLFLLSMIWTALTYNPVRILGGIGIAGVMLAGLVVLGLIITRLSGVTELNHWGVAAVFTALLASVTGVSLYALGVICNYTVSIFHKRPIRQGIFKTSIFKTPLHQHFGWVGTLNLLVGIVVATASLFLSVKGWPIERLWLYLLMSSMMILVGVQMLIYWILLRVLDNLGKREYLTQKDVMIA